jgi:hypothetical protein
MMKLVTSLLLPLMVWAAPDDLQKSSKRPRKDVQPAASASLRGCVDQRGEAYVIRSTDDMARVTALKGKGFSDDNFARYVGQQVKVYGRASNGSFEVTKIDKISETCSH